MLIQTRAEGWRCIAEWHFQAFGSAMQIQLSTKKPSAQESCPQSIGVPTLVHDYTVLLIGYKIKWSLILLIAEFVTSLVNKGIYSWTWFYSSNILRKHKQAFTEKTYRSECPVSYYLGGDP